MEYKFRPASSDDYDFLRALHRNTMKDYVEKTWGWDEEDEEKRFKESFDPDKLSVVVVEGSDAGMIVVEDKGTELFLSKIQILPEYQGRGLGTIIVNDLIKKARQRMIPVALQVLKVNPAKKLYERLGFMQIGETETHYLMRQESN